MNVALENLMSNTIHIQQVLGTGAFSTVLLAKDVITFESVALKMIKKTRLNEVRAKTDLRTLKQRLLMLGRCETDDGENNKIISFHTNRQLFPCRTP
jgi:serine/threonine protein kinase